MTPMTREWVSKAEADYNTAGRELRARSAPNYDAACFHAQQCAEKYLKALLQETGQRFAKVHDLSVLLKQLAQTQPAFTLLQSAASGLSAFAVGFRYPGKSADKTLAQQAFRDCKLIREATRTQLRLPVTSPLPRLRGRSRRHKK